MNGMKKTETGSQSEFAPAISSFSDHLVVSMPVYPKARDDVINHHHISLVLRVMVGILANTSFHALTRGFLVRGGLTLGKLIHNDEIVFGEALVDAVNIEQTLSFYPRTVVSHKIINFLQTNPAFPPEILEKWPRESRPGFDALEKCEDGLYHLDWLADPRFFFMGGSYEKFEKTVRELLEIIQKKLRLLEDKEGYFLKWVWMNSYLERALKKIKTQPWAKPPEQLPA